MKEMTSVATTMMTEEEKTEMEREMNGGVSPASPAGAPVSPTPLSPQPDDAASSATPAPAPQSSTSLVATPVRSPSPARAASPAPATPATATPAPETPLTAAARSPASSSSTNLKDKELHKAEKEREAQGKKRAKISPEQRKKLQELEEERRKNMEERIETLAKKLVDRLRPFVEAKHPGHKDDAETVAFEQRIRAEADDLKLESFGVAYLVNIFSGTATGEPRTNSTASRAGRGTAALGACGCAAMVLHGGEVERMASDFEGLWLYHRIYRGAGRIVGWQTCSVRLRNTAATTGAYKRGLCF